MTSPDTRPGRHDARVACEVPGRSPTHPLVGHRPGHDGGRPHPPYHYPHPVEGKHSP